MPPTYLDHDLHIPPFRGPAHHPAPYDSPQPPHYHHHHQPVQRPPSKHRSTASQLGLGDDPRLSQYTIVKTVGEGSFGKVKLAIHNITKQKVALKIISRKNLTNRDMQGRVEREIAYLQLLRHPHIIKLYTVITTKDDIIMVIEYAGGELFDFLVSNGKMMEDSARRFFQQIICAVEYCHRHKIVHRDLKPENLLLDSSLNVKIADFGLSNIMTDGNFLKTSCGSPNYAAPEVVGGKLYAGPEVDVWSCGVILFVLLCGKLPFDDDFIPNLFKKISQGKYSIPPYLSPEAKDLISKMLVVNPLQRISIPEIRKHEWFKKNLPEYLEPPKEEFFDTGVDFTKLPDLRELERGPTQRLNGEPHEAIVKKLGHIMKYREDDVQDALTKEEPSAIKDAYMIVRENQMMIPRLSNAKNEGFMAQSPPAWDSYLPGSPKFYQNSPHGGIPSRTASPLTLGPQRGEGLGITSEPEDLATTTHNVPPSSPASSICILPSSMPAYHQAYMSGGPAPTPSPPKTPRGTLKPRATSRPFQQGLASLTSAQPQAGSASRAPKKTRWQFGIRSRNAPLEAVSCIYRALQNLGAEWVVDDQEDAAEPGSPHSGRSGDSENGCDSGSDNDDDGREDELEDRAYRSDEGEGEDGDPSSEYRRRHNRRKRRSQAAEEDNVPADPWVIHARWKKLALPARSQPGTPITPLSPISSEDDFATSSDSVYVHMTIQLYQLEHDNYLVDFKCTGYERTRSDATQSAFGDDDAAATTEEASEPEKGRKRVGFQEHLGGDEGGKRVRDRDSVEGSERGGRRKEEAKEVTSPFPFLDLAGKLIVQLANTEAARG